MGKMVSVDIESLLRKRVDQLSPEEKEILRKWYLSHRGRGAKLDIHRRAKHIPAYVKTWIKHPNRYDIPGVDSPPLNVEKEKIGKILRLYNPPYNYPPLHIQEKAKQIIDKLLAKYGLSGYEVFEYMHDRVFPIDRLYTFLIESWINGWDPEELIKELKPIAKSYKEYQQQIRNNILESMARHAIKQYVSRLIDWVKKNGKKSGWKILKVNYYSTTGGYDIKLKKYDPIYKTTSYHVYIILRPTTMNGEKKILMDIMFSKKENVFSGEQSIQYIYSPSELEKEGVYKILSGAFLGQYLIKQGLEKNHEYITDKNKAHELLKKEHVMF